MNKKNASFWLDWCLCALCIVPIWIVNFVVSEIKELEQRIAQGGLPTEELVFLGEYKGWLSTVKIAAFVLFFALIAAAIIIGYITSAESQSSSKEERKGLFSINPLDFFMMVGFMITVRAFSEAIYTTIKIVRLVSRESQLMITEKYFTKLTETMQVDGIMMMIGFVLVTIMAAVSSIIDKKKSAKETSSQA